MGRTDRCAVHIRALDAEEGASARLRVIHIHTRCDGTREDLFIWSTRCPEGPSPVLKQCEERTIDYLHMLPDSAPPGQVEWARPDLVDSDTGDPALGG